MVKNRERRKEVGKVFFDLSKYLLTTIAIGTLITKESLNIKALFIALIASSVSNVSGLLYLST
jgi:hypothetical protein